MRDVRLGGAADRSVWQDKTNTSSGGPCAGADLRVGLGERWRTCSCRTGMRSRTAARPSRGDRARLGRQAGAYALSASLFELASGASSFPVHVNHANEEILIVLAGRPILRNLDGERELATGAPVASPAVVPTNWGARPGWHTSAPHRLACSNERYARWCTSPAPAPSLGTASPVRYSAKLQVGCRVEPSTTDQMAQVARRPAWSAIESVRAEIIPMPGWRDGLAGYLAARHGMMCP